MLDMEIAASQNNIMHDLSVDHVSASLNGKRIALCCCGGIAALESPKIARALRRRGARVEAWATENALRFVGLESLEWATSAPVVTQPSGRAEHISTHDCLLICNATADVLAKAAQGICSDGVSTLIQSAMGQQIPVVIMQTMHESLARSPIVRRNCETLAGLSNVRFLKPRMEESKYKTRPPDEIADEVSHFVNRQRFPLSARKALLAIGGTRVAIDSVRSISNRSSGDFGVQLLKELYRNGFEIELFAGEISVELPNLDQVSVRSVPYYEDMFAAFQKLKGTDYSGVFMLAAVSDFVTEKRNTDQPKKISSQHETVDVRLVRSKKIVALDSFQSIPFRFTCKLTQDDGQEAQDSIERLFATSNSHFVFWNTVAQAFGNGDKSATESKRSIIGKLLRTADRSNTSSANQKFDLENAEPFTTKSALSQRIVSLFSHYVESQK